MKTKQSLLLLLFCALCAECSFAQQSYKNIKPASLKEGMRKKLTIITAGERNLFSAKKSRSASRLTAATYRNYNGAAFDISDSMTYSYISNYGYDPTPETFDFDYISTYLYYNQNNLYDLSKHYSDMGGPIALSDSTVNTFGGSHKLLNSFNDYFTGGVQHVTSIQYNGNEKKIMELDSLYDNGSVNMYKYLFAYNANGKTIELRGSEWIAGAWVEQEIDSLFYDMSGALTQVTVYSYDIPNAVWVNDYKMSYTYNGANKLASSISQIWNGAAWDNDYKTEYIYGAGSKLASQTNSTWNALNWEYESKDSFTYAAGSYPITWLSLYWDNNLNTWNNGSKNDYTYNASNQIETMLSQSWDMVGNVWEPTNNNTYYYQNYTPESVTAKNSLAAELSLYPVPAQDVLNVVVALETSQHTEIIILDLKGNPVMKAAAHQDAIYHDAINIASLPAGHYILLLQGEKGTYSKMFIK
jgi:hypothetical protein